MCSAKRWRQRSRYKVKESRSIAIALSLVNFVFQAGIFSQVGTKWEKDLSKP